MTDHMSLNKQLGIACGVPVALLLGGIGVSGLPTASSTPPAKSVAAANEEFKAQVTPTGLESETSPEAPAEPEVGVSTSDVKSELSGIYTFDNDAAEADAETTTLKPTIEAETIANADVPPAIAADESPIENGLDTGDGIDANILADLTSSDPVPEAPAAEKSDLVWSDPAPASPPKPEIVEADPPSEDLVLVDPASSSTEPAPADPPAPILSEVVATDPEPAESPAPEVTEVVATDPSPADPPAPKVVEVAAADPAPAEPPTPTITEVAAVEAIEPVASGEVATTASVTTEPDTVPDVSSTPVPASPPVVSASVPAVAVATVPAEKPFLGVGIRDASNSKITTLHKSTTAEQLGILVGDELIGVNGYPVRNIATLRAVLKDISVGDAISVSIRRNGAIYKSGPVSLGARPSE